MAIEARLSEFISTLLESTVDSIQGNYLDQMQSYLGAVDSLGRPVEEIARDLDDAAVEEEFRSQSELYASPDEARMALAERELAVGRAILEQGLPKLLIDHGEIRARTSFEVGRSRRDRATPARPRGRGGKKAERAEQSRSTSFQRAEPALRANVLRDRLLSAEAMKAATQISADRLEISVQQPPASAVSSDGKGRAEFEVSVTFKVNY